MPAGLRFNATRRVLRSDVRASTDSGQILSRAIRCPNAVSSRNGWRPPIRHPAVESPPTVANFPVLVVGRDRPGSPAWTRWRRTGSTSSASTATARWVACGTFRTRSVRRYEGLCTVTSRFTTYLGTQCPTTGRISFRMRWPWATSRVLPVPRLNGQNKVRNDFRRCAQIAGGHLDGEIALDRSGAGVRARVSRDRVCNRSAQQAAELPSARIEFASASPRGSTCCTRRNSAARRVLPASAS